MDVAKIKGVNQSSLVPFAGHDPEVRLEPDRVIRDGVVSMDQVEAEPPKLAMTSNDLHQFLGMTRVDMHLRLDARKTIVPSIVDVGSARTCAWGGLGSVCV